MAAERDTHKPSLTSAMDYIDISSSDSDLDLEIDDVRETDVSPPTNSRILPSWASDYNSRSRSQGQLSLSLFLSVYSLFLPFCFLFVKQLEIAFQKLRVLSLFSSLFSVLQVRMEICGRRPLEHSLLLKGP